MENTFADTYKRRDELIKKREDARKKEEVSTKKLKASAEDQILKMHIGNIKEEQNERIQVQNFFNDKEIQATYAEFNDEMSYLYKFYASMDSHGKVDE